MPTAADLDLGVVAVKLRRPVSSQEREELRTIINAHLRGPSTRTLAEQAFLRAAAALAGFGYGEVDLRDLLDREDACLERANRRNGRA